ncbi:hypothetical protein J6590_047068 [Homalodisca vitripennis]|nr:hypothetical protein J6590_047068 [Homalodisca vitripennis]
MHSRNFRELKTKNLDEVAISNFIVSMSSADNIIVKTIPPYLRALCPLPAHFNHKRVEPPAPSHQGESVDSGNCPRQEKTTGKLFAALNKMKQTQESIEYPHPFPLGPPARVVRPRLIDVPIIHHTPCIVAGAWAIYRSANRNYIRTAPREVIRTSTMLTLTTTIRFCLRSIYQPGNPYYIRTASKKIYYSVQHSV